MQQAHVRVGAHDGLAVHLQDQAQHAMRGRMLRAEVHGVVADLLPGFGGIAGEGPGGLVELAHLLASLCARSPSAVSKRASSRITRGTPTRGSTEVTGS